MKLTYFVGWANCCRSRISSIRTCWCRREGSSLKSSVSNVLLCTIIVHFSFHLCLNLELLNLDSRIWVIRITRSSMQFFYHLFITHRLDHINEILRTARLSGYMSIRTVDTIYIPFLYVALICILLSHFLDN